MPIVTYTVYYTVTTYSGREFNTTSKVDIEAPPEDDRELMTVIELKLLDINPDAEGIYIIGFYFT